MKLTRYFFISDRMAALESFQQDLEAAGIVVPQMHLLTLDDSGAAAHHDLHEITSFMKRDIVRSTLIGATMGVITALLVLLVSYIAGWTGTRAGWIPFVFLALVLLGFFTWQGGLWGIQVPNARFEAFDQALKGGRHVFFVDLEPGYGSRLKQIVARHQAVETAGIDHGAPTWIVFSQYHLKRFFTETFP